VLDGTCDWKLLHCTMLHMQVGIGSTRTESLQNVLSWLCPDAILSPLAGHQGRCAPRHPAHPVEQPPPMALPATSAQPPETQTALRILSWGGVSFQQCRMSSAFCWRWHGYVGVNLLTILTGACRPERRQHRRWMSTHAAHDPLLSCCVPPELLRGLLPGVPVGVYQSGDVRGCVINTRLLMPSPSDRIGKAAASIVGRIELQKQA
jgi:hypothetical protein